MKKIFYPIVIMTIVILTACNPFEKKSASEGANEEETVTVTTEEEEQAVETPTRPKEEPVVDVTDQQLIESGILRLEHIISSMCKDGSMYEGVVTTDKQIVFNMVVDEEKLPGDGNLIETYKNFGMTEKTCSRLLEAEIKNHPDAKQELYITGLTMLKKHQYTITIRLIGSRSLERLDCPLDYTSLLR